MQIAEDVKIIRVVFFSVKFGLAPLEKVGKLYFVFVFVW